MARNRPGASAPAPRARADRAPRAPRAVAGPPRGLMGVVHLPPMPGDPRHQGAGGFAGVRELALADARALLAGGVDGLILENFGSTPFAKGTGAQRLPPHQVATLALLAHACKALAGQRPVGVNCLRNDALAALGVAAAAGLDFVRVNVHTGAAVTDQGLIEGEAASSLRYRLSLQAGQVRILADVLVKHAAPLVPTDPGAATEDALGRGLADGVIVTGSATGAPVDPALLQAVRAAAGERPVYVGSGLTPDNAGALLPLVEGAIVGTWLKRGGDVHAPVDEGRVRQMVRAARGRFRRSA